MQQWQLAALMLWSYQKVNLYKFVVVQRQCKYCFLIFQFVWIKKFSNFCNPLLTNRLSGAGIRFASLSFFLVIKFELWTLNWTKNYFCSFKCTLPSWRNGSFFNQKDLQTFIAREWKGKIQVPMKLNNSVKTFLL